MGATFDDLAFFARFPSGLSGFMKKRWTLQAAQQDVHARMARRGEQFLTKVEQNIYAHPRSPYRALLARAGCELGDLRAMVAAKGLEGTLYQLRAEGVYVTFEELKGRKPLVRNGVTIVTSPRDFDNPLASPLLASTTGGSTGAATQVNQNFAFFYETAPTEIITLHAYGALGAPTLFWSNLYPAGGMRRIFQTTAFGQPIHAWSSLVGWFDSKSWLKYSSAVLYMLFWMRVLGVNTPFPRQLKMEQAIKMVRRIREALDREGRCVIYAPIGRAMRLANAAQHAGIDLTGAVMRGGGEPLTSAKARVLTQRGARYVPTYTMAEGSYVGSGCANPQDPSDVHVMQHLYGFITYPYQPPGFSQPVPAFHTTALLASAPKILLNYQTDDYGTVEERACGCELESYGLSVHLRDIYSYSKVVGEGVTLLGSELLHILEVVLPTRFGGTPLDYQLAEQENAEGLTRLYLYISPRVTLADEQEVIRVFLNALREASNRADFARAIWQQTDTLQIRRQEPVLTARGKLLPLRLKSG